MKEDKENKAQNQVKCILFFKFIHKTEWLIQAAQQVVSNCMAVTNQAPRGSDKGPHKDVSAKRKKYISRWKNLPLYPFSSLRIPLF